MFKFLSELDISWRLLESKLLSLMETTMSPAVERMLRCCLNGATKVYKQRQNKIEKDSDAEVVQFDGSANTLSALFTLQLLQLTRM